MHTMYIAIFNLNQIYITLWFEDAAYKWQYTAIMTFKSVHENKTWNSMYQMIQNQGSLHLLFIQTVMCVLNDWLSLIK